MSFPAYADSDADDEYERSVLTSPMPPTDDETSPTESELGSNEHTPTTFGGPDFDRSSPGTIITEWTPDECAHFLTTLNLGQYCNAFLENMVVGVALMALRHDELKEMGISSVGHRLTILKGVYDAKIRQGVPIESDQYIPPSADASVKNKQATQEDISRLIHSMQIRDTRILEAEAEVRRMQDEYKKLREELLPIFRMVKESNDALPSPVLHSGSTERQPQNLSRKPSKNTNNLRLQPSKPAGSPTYNQSIPEGRSIGSQDTELGPSAAAAAATSHLAAAMNGLSVGGTATSTSPNNPSPTASPNIYHQQQINNARGGYGSASQASVNTGHYQDGYYNGSAHTSTASTLVPDSNGGMYAGRSGSLGTPSIRTMRAAAAPSGPSMRETTPSFVEQHSAASSANNVDVWRSFRVSLEDPCHKVLPAALKKYNIQADWKQYALYIVYGDQERCLGLDEKPLILFKQLDKEGKKPMFMLRRHVAPAEGYTGPSTGGNGFGVDQGGGGRGAISLPGGVL